MKKIITIFFVILLCVLVGISAARYISNKQITSSPHSINATPTPSVAQPLTLTIAKLGITSHIESVRLDASLRMDVPKGIGHTGWYSLGPRPGETGNAVIDGHFDTPTGAPSVFYYLGTLKKGDTIQVTDEKDITHTFLVTSVTHYPDQGFPIVQVFGPTTEKNLNLITCSGTWDKVAHNYSQRTVVFSTLAEK